jgi:hypothetical protein
MHAMDRGAGNPSFFEALLWIGLVAAIILITLFIAGVFAWLLPVLFVVWVINFLNRVSPPRK